MRIPYRRRPSPVPNATNGRKEKGIACSEYHKAKNDKALPVPNATKARKEESGAKIVARLIGEKQKENDIKNRSLSNLGCDVGLEPTTPRTTIWCSTN